MYIVFKGIVGTGKTTQSKLLAKYLKSKFPNKKIIWAREPGGSEIADEIRKLVQGTKFEEKMNPLCETYLYAASRAQTLREVVKPALDQGVIVIFDRSVFTSLSYQAASRGLGIDKVWKINEAAVEGILPNIVLFFDLDIKTATQRTFDEGGDKFESMPEGFFKRARTGYKKVGKRKFGETRFITIDALGTIEEVQDRVNKVVFAKLN